MGENIIEAYPLQWPLMRPRTPNWKRKQAAFGKRRTEGYGRQALSIGQARDRLLDQLRQLGARSIVINSDMKVKLNGMPYSAQRSPDDPGVAVYFKLHKEPHCLPCDKWDRVADNLAAIAKHVDATRGQLRWGVGDVEAYFAGFKALPPGSSSPAPAGIVVGPPWWEVFGVEHGCDNIDVVERYRVLARKHHPDRGGSHEKMAELSGAYEAFKYERQL